LTSFKSNSICVIFDQLTVYRGGVTEDVVDIGASGTFWFKIQYEYDGLEFTEDHGRVFLEESIPMKWNNVTNRWEYFCIYNNVGRRSLSIKSINDDFYGITTTLDRVKSQSIEWSASLTISLEPSTILSDFKVDIEGKLSYLNGTGIPDESLLLAFSVTSGESWNDISSVTTSENGSYNLVWLPIATGNYLVKSQVISSEVFNQTAFAVISYQGKYAFSVSSNSTVSDMIFNSTRNQLSFVVDGPSKTIGYADVAVSRELVQDISTLKVVIDEDDIDYSLSSTDESWIIHISYQHSKHMIIVTLSEIISRPFIQTPLGIGLLIIGVIAVIAISVIYLRKQGIILSSKKL
jgi:hypothetical protein